MFLDDGLDLIGQRLRGAASVTPFFPQETDAATGCRVLQGNGPQRSIGL